MLKTYLNIITKQNYYQILEADLISGKMEVLFYKDSIIEENYNKGDVVNYMDDLLYFVEKNIIEDDQEFVLKELSLVSLKVLANSSEIERRLEVRIAAVDFVYRWMEIVLYCNKESGKVLITIKDIHDKKINDGIIDKFIYKDSDYFILLDAKQNKYKMISHSETGTPLPPVICQDYNKEIINYANEYVVKDYKQYTIEQMKLDTVIRQLERNHEHSFYVGVNDPTRGFTYKCVRYRYYDRKNQIVLLERTDVTEMYLQEKKKQEKLEEALKKEEAASNTKSEFMAKISHDMRTPMNGIIGLTNIMLEEKNISDYVKENLKQIEYSSKYLLGLINDILDINKYEVNDFKIKLEEIDGMKIVENTLMSTMLAAKDKNIQMTVDNKIKKWHKVLIDPIRMHQLANNILTNAVKFTPENGKIHVELEIISEENNTSLTKMVVKDSGIGISEEFLSKIFDPFTQEHTGSTTNYGGTGLGLAISKNIVKLMGGTIKAESKLNEGTIITAIIPFKWAENPECDTVKKSPKDIHFTGKRFLVCEDHPINQKIAVKLLEKRGVLVELAEDGAIGYRMFVDSLPNYYDCILMDIHMPKMDGLETAIKIRELGRPDAKTVPIIAMTANAFDEDREKSLMAGMNEHLAKPIDPELMYQIIDKLIYN
ncbi:MAG: ATP-binding protein [Anaerovoracaceae bacterium]